MFAYLRHRFHPLWRLRRQRWFRALQQAVDFPAPCRATGGVVFYAYVLRDFSFFVGHAGIEQRTMRMFAAIAREFRPDLFLDVGANLGLYSWQAASLLPDCRLWLFEPDPRNVRLLERTLRRNRLTRAIVVPKAVAANCGRAEFLLDPASGATGSLQNQTAQPSSLHHAYGLRETLTVDTVSLDSLAAEFTAPGRMLIKIDVEGAEGLVLAGTAQLLRQRRPVVVFECFEPAKAQPLFAADYAIYDLGEGFNYLAVPAENAALRALAEKDAQRILPPP
jgi:FkbM family methyltransferase